MIAAEAYFRIPPELDRSARVSLAATLFPIAELGASEFLAAFGSQRVAEVYLEDGSTRVWVRVRASAIGLLTVVAGYGSIRSAIDYAHQDGRRAAVWMSEHALPLLPVTPDVRRSRAPAGTRLRRLFEAVESGDMSVDEAARRGEAILKEYGEEAENIRAVTSAIREELSQVRPRTRSEPSTRLPSVNRPTIASPIRRGRQLRVLRDPETGQLVFSER